MLNTVLRETLKQRVTSDCDWLYLTAVTITECVWIGKLVLGLRFLLIILLNSCSFDVLGAIANCCGGEICGWGGK